MYNAVQTQIFNKTYLLLLKNSENMVVYKTESKVTTSYF